MILTIRTGSLLITHEKKATLGGTQTFQMVCYASFPQYFVLALHLVVFFFCWFSLGKYAYIMYIVKNYHKE
jgi:hypothetical protein